MQNNLAVVASSPRTYMTATVNFGEARHVAAYFNDGKPLPTHYLEKQHGVIDRIPAAVRLMLKAGEKMKTLGMAVTEERLEEAYKLNWDEDYARYMAVPMCEIRDVVIPEAPTTRNTNKKEAVVMAKNTDSELQVFSFDQKSVRVIMKDGAPWWVAKDVCDVLGLGNSRMALEPLDDDEKGVSKIDTLGGTQSMSIINEPGLYSLVLRSNKPEAKAFKRWITHDVLPAIRRTGEYATPAAQSRKADRNDEFTRRRLEVMEKNANYRMAKLLLQSIDKFADVMTSESKTVFMAEYTKLTTKHDITHMLPAATEKWYTATELGVLFGVSSSKIGKTANKHGLKAPEGQSNEYGTWIRSKSQHSSHEIMTWVYCEKSREWFAEHFGGKDKAA